MEFTVNQALEDHIGAPLPKVDGSKSAITIDDENEVDSDEDVGDSSITNVTRDAIYNQLAGAKQDDPYIDPKKILSIKSMTEAEGKSYLDVLRAQRSVSFSRSVSRKIVGSVASRLCHPLDECTAILAESDVSMIDELSMSLGWMFSHLGGLKGYFMMGMYIASSWMKNWENPAVRWEEKNNLKKITDQNVDKREPGPTLSNPSTVSNNASPSVPSNGGQ